LVTIFQMCFEVFPSARFERAQVTRKRLFLAALKSHVIVQGGVVSVRFEALDALMSTVTV